ncbi:MAG: glycoside hydrolase family 3 N-terminal domain-containing protein [Thermoanaerobaculaceae bacterium]
MSAFLVCGVSGPELDAGERALLEGLRPGGIVLFARNVVDGRQLAGLTAELAALPSHPYLAIDLEGGRVNRLEALIGPLPCAAGAAGAGVAAVRALAEAAGGACAHFGIGVDFAPVVDVGRPDGWLRAEARCLGATEREVRSGAAAYLEGLEGFGVRGCLKHYPGLGSGRVDSHRELPLLDDSAVAESDLFHALLAPGRAVMVAHALAPALGEAACPASLSRTVVGRLRRLDPGPVIADDLEMGALSEFGSIPERAAAALGAGCDQVLVCNAMAAREEVAAHIASAERRDPVLAATLRRSEARVRVFGRSELADVSWDRVRELADRARALAGGAA